MEFRTKIPIIRAEQTISYQDKIMMLGSCFAENIGGKFLASKFDVNLNPFGILYNPSSICRVVERLITKESFCESEILFHNGIYQSLWHHGRFSDINKQHCLKKINDSFSQACVDFHKANILLITFGTSYVFKHKEQSLIVANCHKLPASQFDRYRLSVADIVKDWSALLDKISVVNPQLRIIFTVSPVRHLRDGAYDNQLSKATLLLAIDELCKLNNTAYFPSYEIVLDELRDYRFYAEDMVHPNLTAIEYIWQRFSDTYFSTETLNIMAEWDKIALALNHRPINERGEEYKHFLNITNSKLESFNRKYPYICCEKEIDFLKDKLRSLR